MKKLIRNWSVVRILQLAFCIFIIIQGIYSFDWMLIIFGGLLSLMPILNMNCCMTRSCNVASTKNDNNQLEDVSYEEVN